MQITCPRDDNKLRLKLLDWFCEECDKNTRYHNVEVSAVREKIKQLWQDTKIQECIFSEFQCTFALVERDSWCNQWHWADSDYVVNNDFDTPLKRILYQNFDIGTIFGKHTKRKVVQTPTDAQLRLQLIDWFIEECEQVPSHDIEIGAVLDKISSLWKDNPTKQVEVCDEFFKLYGVKDGRWFVKYNPQTHTSHDRVDSNLVMSFSQDTALGDYSDFKHKM